MSCAPQETLDVFVPLANRLGVWTIKSQLEDLAFQTLQVSPQSKICRPLMIVCLA